MDTETITESMRANGYDEIAPLIELCKNGHLFAVQKWIADGKPVNLPALDGRSRKSSPLEYAIKRGFHSLAEVLLRAGALQSDGSFSAMSLALENRRFDLIQLLVTCGFAPKSVDMSEVFATWDPEIMKFFLERGADPENGMPLCRALINRTRTAIGIYREYKERFKSFQEQANIALRFHCRDGNLKWVSLMIWAGADPLAPGESEPDDEPDSDEGGLSAVGFAALYGNFEIFDLKPVKSKLNHPAMYDVLRYGCNENGIPVITKILKSGLHPNDQENGGCSILQYLVEKFSGASIYSYSNDYWDFERKESGTDSHWSRNILKIIHLFLRSGAKWKPSKDEIGQARRGFLKVTPDYLVEFVWLLAKYDAGGQADIEELIRTPSIKKHARSKIQKIKQYIESMKIVR